MALGSIASRGSKVSKGSNAKSLFGIEDDSESNFRLTENDTIEIDHDKIEQG